MELDIEMVKSEDDDTKLQDHADTILLELEPTLRTYCLISLLSKEKPLDGSNLKKNSRNCFARDSKPFGA